MFVVLTTNTSNDQQGAAPVVAGLGGVVLDTRALHSKTPKGKFGPNLVFEIDGFRSCKTNRIDSNRDWFGTILVFLL